MKKRTPGIRAAGARSSIFWLRGVGGENQLGPTQPRPGLAMFPSTPPSVSSSEKWVTNSLGSLDSCLSLISPFSSGGRTKMPE